MPFLIFSRIMNSLLRDQYNTPFMSLQTSGRQLKLLIFNFTYTVSLESFLCFQSAVSFSPVTTHLYQYIQLSVLYPQRSVLYNLICALSYSVFLPFIVNLTNSSASQNVSQRCVSLYYEDILLSYFLNYRF